MKNYLKRQKRLMKIIATLFQFSMIGAALGYGVQFATIVIKKSAQGVSSASFAMLVVMQVIILLHGWVNLGERSYLIMIANIIFCVGIAIFACLLN